LLERVTFYLPTLSRIRLGLIGSSFILRPDWQLQLLVLLISLPD